MWRSSVAHVACALVGSAMAAVPADKITHLPGYPGPPKTDQYSGYLEVDDPQGKMYYHYWLATSQSDTPTKDPVVLWLNGGPGASSIGYGLFSELGPYLFTDESFQNKTMPGVPDVFENPHSWNTVANMLFLETPPSVGYSYCGSGTGNGSSPKCHWDDATQAAANYGALLSFFDSFPEYKDNEFFITGESYGGMYVPTLVEQIYNKSGVNLKGFAVGNGVIGHEDTYPGADAVRLAFLHNSRFVSEELWNEILTECGPQLTKTNLRCETLKQKAERGAGDYYIYNVYDTCGEDQVKVDGPSASEKPTWLRSYLEHEEHFDSLPGPLMEPDEYPCGRNKGVVDWINLPEVRAALHVKSEEFYGHAFSMEAGRALNYHGSRDYLIKDYPTWIAKYRTLIYNGDFDGCVPYLANQGWTYHVADQMGWEQSRSWQPWSVDSQVAGYATTWVGEGANNFTFATVKGSGHMVPQYKARQALALFTSFINGYGPLYDAPGESQ